MSSHCCEYAWGDGGWIRPMDWNRCLNVRLVSSCTQPGRSLWPLTGDAARCHPVARLGAYLEVEMALALVDDLDGSGGNVDQVTFGFEGKAYVLDLSEANRSKLAAALEEFLTVASAYDNMPDPPVNPYAVVRTAPVATPKPVATVTPAPKSAGRKPRRGGIKIVEPLNAKPKATPVTDTATMSVAEKKAYFAKVRGWANENNYAVSETGRIPVIVLRAYESAGDQGFGG